MGKSLVCASGGLYKSLVEGLSVIVFIVSRCLVNEIVLIKTLKEIFCYAVAFNLRFNSVYVEL